MPGWTNPLTWSSVVVTVPQLNQQIRDNLLFLYDERTPPTVNTITTTGTQAALAIPSGKGPLIILANNATDLVLQGITAPGVNGQSLTIYSIGAGKVLLEHQHGSASASNRLVNFATVGQTPLAAGSGVATYRYDGTAARWRLQHHEQGAFITPAFAAGDFIANGSLFWTVGSGDVTTMAYKLSGRQLTVIWHIATTTIGGTPNTQLIITNAQWGGFTPAKSVIGPSANSDNGSPSEVGIWQVLAGVGNLFNFRNAVSNWSLSTNLTGIYGSATFEVT